MRAPIIVCALLAAGAARAEDTVVSPRPDAVEVTIYRDLFALITETRTVDLPAGPVTLAFEGVVETLLPQSTVLQELDRALVERNYDHDALTPRSLFTHSIGTTVTLTRTRPGSGSVTRQRATIVAAGKDGVTFRAADGIEALHCSGVPESVSFDAIPAGLRTTPRLSVRLAPGSAGTRTIRLSYLAHGFAWSADYVARLGARPGRMDLTGWVTLRNLTNAAFRDARVQLVAGRLNLLDEDDDGTSLIGATADLADDRALRSAREERLEEFARETGHDETRNEMALLTRCYPFGPRLAMASEGIGAFPDVLVAESLQRIASDSIEAEEIVVTGMRAAMAEREGLGDYQLYRLPWRADLGARQTKQAQFLRKPDVKVDRFYGFRLIAADAATDEPFARPTAMVAFENRKPDGLGEPLPEGTVRFFDAASAGGAFIGEARISDKPVGAPVELALGAALDLTLNVRVTDLEAEFPDDEAAGDVRVGVANAKPAPVSVEIRLALGDLSARARILHATQRTGRKSGDHAWRFEVPANETKTLGFRVRVPEL